MVRYITYTLLNLCKWRTVIEYHKPIGWLCWEERAEYIGQWHNVLQIVNDDNCRQMKWLGHRFTVHTTHNLTYEPLYVTGVCSTCHKRHDIAFSQVLTTTSETHNQLYQVLPGVRVHSHWYEYESGYPYTASSKHEIAYIPVVAVHIDTSSVRVRITCEFHSCE